MYACIVCVYIHIGFAGGSDSKESVCNSGDLGSGRPPGEGNGNQLQHSCLENPMDSLRGRKELDMTEVTEHAHIYVNVYMEKNLS